MSILPLRSFRLVCKALEVPLVEELLHMQGFRFEPEPFFSLSRRLVHEPIPLGASLAAKFGYIYIQDRSSMLPPIALAPEEGTSVLDMCASPGSKTSLLGQLVGGTGFVLGNEPSKSRLGTLRANLSSLNLLSCATLSFSGERLPLPGASWPAVLLDPPCSGWGTVEKNPQVMSLWQGDKVQPLVSLQQRLLAEAHRLLQPGGTLVYSTCTTNVAENEEQVLYAQEELGLELIALDGVPGFSFAEPELGVPGVWRVLPGEDGQGFFVALFRKPLSVMCEEASASREKEFSAYAGKISMQPEAGRRSKRGRVHEREKNTRLARDGELLSRDALVSLQEASGSAAWLDTSLLPPGDIAVFADIAHFLPEASRQLIPQGTPWKGFPLGRLTPGGIRVSPALRGLMKSQHNAVASGVPVLDVDSVELLSGLLTGQSIPVDAQASGMNLYFKGLPLYHLSVKGRRAIAPSL